MPKANEREREAGNLRTTSRLVLRVYVSRLRADGVL